MNTIALCLTLCSAFIPYVQGGGAVSIVKPKIRLIRTISGSKTLEQGGQVVISDPRTTFYVPEDKKVMVYFEWELAPGKHHFEANWKNPQGKIVVNSEFDADSKWKRFAGMWELNLAGGMAMGNWTVESTVDGESAGSHSVQITTAEKPADLPQGPRMLTQPELFQKAANATVTLQRFDKNGRQIGEASGFFLQGGDLITAFQAVDGATSVKIKSSEGTPQPLSTVVAFDRIKDWIVFKTPNGTAAGGLPRSAGKMAVGEKFESLNINSAGGRTLVDASISGVQSSPGGGERFSIVSSLPHEAVGSPVFDDYGEVVGVLASTEIPGSVSLYRQKESNLAFIGFPGNISYSELHNEVSFALPLPQVPENVQTISYQQLLDSGQITPPVYEKFRISRGTLTKGLSKTRESMTWPQPLDERFTYNRQDGDFG